MNALKVVTRNRIVYWRVWKTSFFLTVLTPVMFLSAMGLGLGSLVENDRAFGGVEYLTFFATGMLAATCMQTGVFGATYPIMAKIVWQRNYEAMLASPLSVRDIFLGEMFWIGVMLAQLAIPFFAVMAAFGIVDSPMALLAIPSVLLVGISCATVVAAMTASLQTDEAYTWLFRLVVTPLFLLSGTFFPIEELPAWGKAVAQLTPLFHGVELVRQFMVEEPDLTALWHVGYLLALFALGTFLGIRAFGKRLQP
jgi:lipooligosaccharide transport system permease protein